MRIVHIAPNSPYNDYWGYQDNLLPKYQRRLGHDVTLIITTRTHRDGKIIDTQEMDYRLRDGVRVIRKNYKQYVLPMLTGVLSFIPTYELLCELEPDLIMCHGLISYTIFDAIRYKKKHPACVIIEDNHMDYNIGNQFLALKDKLIRLWLRWMNRRSIKYVDRVYGVTPCRKVYAEDYFSIPQCKTDILIMGADDDQLHLDQKFVIRDRIRKEYGINSNDYLIVTGGKIDRKKRVDVLIRACSQMEKEVKLLIFGNVVGDLQVELERSIKEHSNIIYIGWIDSEKVYDYFFAADLVFFPGQHSVLWEQACASKVPCVFSKWEGMDHVNNGGNSDFVSPITEEAIIEKIRELRFTEKYNQMKSVATSDKTDIFLYSKIAKKSLECIK